MDEWIEKMIEKGEFSFTRARILIYNIKDKDEQKIIAKMAIEDKLNPEDMKTVIKSVKGLKKKGEQITVKSLRAISTNLKKDINRLNPVVSVLMKRCDILKENIGQLLSDPNFLKLMKKEKIKISQSVFSLTEGGR